tara:strand:+ start:573 stop:674 length:102 start_codon:yes stop_codon:yes gene_type:complete
MTRTMMKRAREKHNREKAKVVYTPKNSKFSGWK